MKRKEILRTGILIAVVLTLMLTANAFAQPEGKIADNANQIVGIWEGEWKGGLGYRQFKADGTMATAGSVEELNPDGSEKFWFEGKVFNVEKAANPGLGKYEVTIQKEKGKATKLIFTIIDEPKQKRGIDMSAPMTQVK